MRLYAAMAGHFGPCRWWPGESPFEVAVGAVLTQNTAWRNVEKALHLLRQADALRPSAILNMPLPELEACLRPSGFFRQKALRLRALVEYFAASPGWDKAPGSRSLAFLQGRDTARLRRELLAIRGIGPETADSILLYALHRPVFVVDAYTRRLLGRHVSLFSGAQAGFAPEAMTYDALQAFFMGVLPLDVALYNEYHALIVRTGNGFCKKSKPLCEECPLGGLLGHAAD